ncbi:MAG: phosphoglucosamine mutase [Dehalococcoidales bacterium]|nr:phosphoglucosamine mutase [Dehalococcoidales bacterium]
MQLFGTSGIRRLFDEDLVQLALRVGMALGKSYHSVVVANDTRTSAGVLKHAVISGILSSGARCSDGGILSTPTLAFAARNFQAGVMITASHNPPEYNGIKLINPDGAAFSPAQCRQVEELVCGGLPWAASWQEIGSSKVLGGAVEEHSERILKDLPSGLGIKVVVDCGCGPASGITPYLLRRLGCRVVGLNCYPSGFFPHNPEPIEANLGELIKATKDFDADLGIAHDGDADRMMAVDDKGRFVPGDKLLGLFSREVGAKEVVTTLDASMAIEEMGFKVTRTRIGDTAVSEELKSAGDFGGEPSGSWIFPGISLCPDGIYAAGRIAVIAGNNKLSALIDEIPSYPIIRGSVGVEGVAVSELEPRLAAMNPLSLSKRDGIRLGFADSWLLIRSSGTEPKVRITAEARSRARAEELYDLGIRIVKECGKVKKEGSL